MKYLMVCMISLSIYAQQQINVPVQLYNELSKNKDFNNYTGSYYVYDNFQPGSVVLESGTEVGLLLNVNAYTQQIEFKSNSVVSYFLKYNDQLKIKIAGDMFQYFSFERKNNVGKLISEINSNKLYLSYFAILKPPVPSSNGYDLPKPGKIDVKKRYFMKINGLYTFLDGRKSVLNAFPKFKGFIKSKKIKFKSDFDYITFFEEVNNKLDLN